MFVQNGTFLQTNPLGLKTITLIEKKFDMNRYTSCSDGKHLTSRKDTCQAVAPVYHKRVRP